MMRSSTSVGSSSGTFSSSALTMVADRSSGRISTSEPFPARPMGLRAVATMTASGMDTISSSMAACRSSTGQPGATMRGGPAACRRAVR